MLCHLYMPEEQQNVAGFPVIAAAVRSKLLPEMAPIRGANEQE